MSRHWINQIKSIRMQLLSMGSHAETQVQQAIEALEKLNLDRALQVIKNDDELDEMDVSLEEECLRSIALYQPVASDLRLIASSMSVGHELERIGDLAASIAQSVARLRNILVSQQQFVLPDCLKQSCHLAMEMLRESLDAFIAQDTNVCRELIAQDQKLDQLHSEIFQWLKEGIQRSPSQIDWMIEVTNVSKNIERIADHVTNIAEIVIYWVEGEIVRHQQGVDHPEESPS